MSIAKMHRNAERMERLRDGHRPTTLTLSFTEHDLDAMTQDEFRLRIDAAAKSLRTGHVHAEMLRLTQPDAGLRVVLTSTPSEAKP